ncbi:MAG: elongation factor G [Boseongicola sp.]|nr:elongation factor G [Boseongicola sp.]
MRAISVVGPSQSGKTALVAALAGLEGFASQPKILTCGTALTTFAFMGDAWSALDIPGGQDNLAQVGPALASSDAAVLCVAADSNAAVLSSPYLRMLEASGIPTFLFINKVDAVANRVADIVASIQPYCRHAIVLRQVPIREDGTIVGAVDLISERAWEFHEGARSSLVKLPAAMQNREHEARADLLEALADFDDGLLEQIIEDQTILTEEVYGVATRALQHHDLVPALLGSAGHGNGILRLMKSLRHEVPQVGALRERLSLSDDDVAISCLADQVKHVGKTVLIRALQDSLSAGEQLGGSAVSSLNGADMKKSIRSVNAGEFAFTIRSDGISPARFLTANSARELPDWADSHAPLFHRLIRPVHDHDDAKLWAAMARLSEIDPGLVVSQDESTGALEVGVQGQQHLQRAVDTLSAIFGIEVECSEVPSVLRETIRRKVEKRHRHRKQSGGAGQFADVLVDVFPRDSGAGFEFTETVKGGAVPRKYIPSVEAGARDALAAGPAGHPVVDVGVTLRDGKTHSVDSSDYAFRMAGQHAVKEALAEAGTIVLQPIMTVEIHVPSVFSGSLVQLVGSLKGNILGFDAHPTANGWDIFRAHLPMDSQEELARHLGGATRGTAWFSSELDHYEELRTRTNAKS